MFECGLQPQPATEVVIITQQLMRIATEAGSTSIPKRKFASTLTGRVFGGAYFQIFYIDGVADYHSMKNVAGVLAWTSYSLGEFIMFMIISMAMPIRILTDVEASEPSLPWLLLEPWILFFPTSSGPLLSTCRFGSFFVLSMSFCFHQMSNKLT